MTEIGADEITRTRDCKVAGCLNEAVAHVGLYALLCEEHRELERRRKVAAGPQPRRLELVTGSCEQSARELVKAGRELDRARAALEKRRKHLRPAEETVARAERAWIAAVERLGAVNV